MYSANSKTAERMCNTLVTMFMMCTHWRIWTERNRELSGCDFPCHVLRMNTRRTQQPSIQNAWRHRTRAGGLGGGESIRLKFLCTVAKSSGAIQREVQFGHWTSSLKSCGVRQLWVEPQTQQTLSTTTKKNSSNLRVRTCSELCTVHAGRDTREALVDCGVRDVWLESDHWALLPSAFNPVARSLVIPHSITQIWPQTHQFVPHPINVQSSHNDMLITNGKKKSPLFPAWKSSLQINQHQKIYWRSGAIVGNENSHKTTYTRTICTWIVHVLLVSTTWNNLPSARKWPHLLRIQIDMFWRPGPCDWEVCSPRVHQDRCPLRLGAHHHRRGSCRTGNPVQGVPCREWLVEWSGWRGSPYSCLSCEVCPHTWETHWSCPLDGTVRLPRRWWCVRSLRKPPNPVCDIPVVPGAEPASRAVSLWGTGPPTTPEIVLFVRHSDVDPPFQKQKWPPAPPAVFTLVTHGGSFDVGFKI